MKRFLLFSAVLGVLLAADPRTASADLIFSDNFNSENGGNGVLNYTAFANWTVSDGTVDLIGNGYFDFQPGYGLYVDMDGSTGNAGKLLSSPVFNLNPGKYELRFDLAGNHRNNANEMVSVQVALGSLASQTYTLARDDDFQQFVLPFSVITAGAIPITFEGTGGDNIGMLLDNVQLVAVPAPGVALLMGLGIGLVGWFKRRLA